MHFDTDNAQDKPLACLLSGQGLLRKHTPPQGYSNAFGRSDADSEQLLPRLHQASQTPLPHSCQQPRAPLQRPSLSGDPQHSAAREAAAATQHQPARGSRALPCPEQTQPELATHRFTCCTTIQTDRLYSLRNLVDLEESQTKSLQQ